MWLWKFGDASVASCEFTFLVVMRGGRRALKAGRRVEGGSLMSADSAVMFVASQPIRLLRGESTYEGTLPCAFYSLFNTPVFSHGDFDFGQLGLDAAYAYFFLPLIEFKAYEMRPTDMPSQPKTWNQSVAHGLIS